MDEYSGYKELATEMCIRAAMDALTAKYIMTLDRNNPLLAGMPAKYDYDTARKVAPVAYHSCMQFLKDKCELYSGLTVETMMQQTERAWKEKGGRLDKWNFWDCDDKREYYDVRNYANKTADKYVKTANHTRKVIYTYTKSKAREMRIRNNYVIATENKLIRHKGKERQTKIMKLHELYKAVPDHHVEKLEVRCIQTEFDTFCATVTEEGANDEYMRAYSDNWADALIKLAKKMEEQTEEMEGYSRMLEKEFKR